MSLTRLKRVKLNSFPRTKCFITSLNSSSALSRRRVASVATSFDSRSFVNFHKTHKRSFSKNAGRSRKRGRPAVTAQTESRAESEEEEEEGQRSDEDDDWYDEDNSWEGVELSPKEQRLEDQALSEWDSRFADPSTDEASLTISDSSDLPMSHPNIQISNSNSSSSIPALMPSNSLALATGKSISRLSHVSKDVTLFDFREFGLRKKLENTLTLLRLTPLPVQSVVYDAVTKMESRMIRDGTVFSASIIAAAMGSGKTIAYLLPALNKLDPTRKGQIVIVAPTNELCEQIKSVANTLIRGTRIGKQLKHGGDLISQKMVSSRMDTKKRMKMDVSKPLENAGLVFCVKSTDSLDYCMDMLSLMKPSIVIGTPKRVRELMMEGSLNPKKVESFVFDECDCMFDIRGTYAHRNVKKRNKRRHSKAAELLLKGVIKQDRKNNNKNDDINSDARHCHVMFVGATVPKQLRNSLTTMMQPFPIQMISMDDSGLIAATAAASSSASPVSSPKGIAHQRYLSPNVRHQYISVDEESYAKAEVVSDLIDQWHRQFTRAMENKYQRNETKEDQKKRDTPRQSPSAVLVFVRKESSPLEFAQKLNEAGDVRAMVMHEFAGDRRAREHFLKQARNGHVDCVVASESLARGIDWIWLDHVIIAEMPRSTASFLHMSGRTGRLGGTGTVTCVCDSEDEIRMQFHLARLGIHADEVTDLRAFGFSHSWNKADPSRMIESGGIAKAFPLIAKAAEDRRLHRRIDGGNGGREGIKSIGNGEGNQSDAKGNNPNEQPSSSVKKKGGRRRADHFRDCL